MIPLRFPVLRTILFISSLLLVFLPGRMARAAEPGAPRDQRQLVQSLQGLPLAFEPNVGQADADIDYVARSAGYAVALSPAGMALELSDTAAPASLRDALENTPAILSRDFALPGRAEATWNPVQAHAHEAADESAGQSVIMRLLGARTAARAVPQRKLPGTVNYLLGNDRTRWRSHLPTYGKVRYSEVYKNIDVVYYGNPRQLEFDFSVRPGGDPATIRMSFPVSAGLRLSERGDLLISSVGGKSTTLHAPVTYQIIAGVRRAVASRFMIHPDRSVGFTLAEYDPTATLVIDPTLSYSTFLGGTGSDEITGIAVDSSGNIYVTGYTTASNFPTATPITPTRPGGNSDIFVAKIAAAGNSLVYSTYLGGSGFDHGHAIAVDSAGVVTIAGDTSSPNFPVQSPIQPVYGGGSADLFVARLNAAGSALSYSTYLGGSGTDASGASESFSKMLFVDAGGSAYVAALSTSANFPTVAALQSTFGGQADAVIAKLNATGSTLVFSTFLGGGGVDVGTSVSTGPSGDVFVTGGTNSTNFPTQTALDPTLGGGTCGSAACPDAFVAKLNAAGSALTFSTYVGGDGLDEADGIAVDSSGAAHIAGFTTSTNFPTQNPFQGVKGAGADVFVSKLNAAGSALVYSTYLGGGGDDVGLAIRLDNLGRAYVSGYTGSNAYPIAGATQGSRTGIENAFVTVVNSTGSALDFSTYLGGNTLEYGTSVDLDATRNVFVGGLTFSGNFLTANPLQAAIGGGTCGTAPNTFICEDGFIVKYSSVAVAPSVTSLSPASVVGGGPAFTLTVNGTGFTANSAVRVGSLTRTTTFVNATQLTAAINAADIAAAGTLQISVFGGAPDNLVSNTVALPVTAAANAPLVSQGGVVNNASFAPSPAPLAPGSIAAIFGQRLTDGSSSLSSSFDTNGRLATTLAGARVTLNNIAAPIFYATPGQMGIQVPVELAGLSTASLVVTVGGLASAPASVNIASSAPGIFTANQSGSGPGAITHADGSPVSAASPASPGEVVIIYLTGLGTLVPSVATGVRAGASPTATPAVVTFNGVAGVVDYSGSAPGFVGLNQINVHVPEGVLPSDTVQVLVRIDGRGSNTATIAVR